MQYKLNIYFCLFSHFFCLVWGLIFVDSNNFSFFLFLILCFVCGLIYLSINNFFREFKSLKLCYKKTVSKIFICGGVFSDMGLIASNSVFRVSDKARFKLVSSATETS